MCPAPAQTTVSGDELVFPHRYWVANEHCQYLNVFTQNLTPATKKPVMRGFQAEGAAPLVTGEPFPDPETRATAIRIGNPASWKLAEAARECGLEF